jgi:hypothetical protein
MAFLRELAVVDQAVNDFVESARPVGDALGRSWASSATEAAQGMRAFIVGSL